nr:hypothetical protein Iba_chr13eCG8900 [Ipomoea batatas]
MSPLPELLVAVTTVVPRRWRMGASCVVAAGSARMLSSTKGRGGRDEGPKSWRGSVGVERCREWKTEELPPRFPAADECCVALEGEREPTAKPHRCQGPPLLCRPCRSCLLPLPRLYPADGEWELRALSQLVPPACCHRRKGEEDETKVQSRGVAPLVLNDAGNGENVAAASSLRREDAISELRH